eukprot:2661550-Pyramimonas_sp.AAC.1
MLKWALSKFKHDTGLGVDCMNPRCWLLLPRDFLERLIDLMMLWEKKLSLPRKYATQIIFQGKPDGAGLRPLALIVSVLRAWAKVRQVVARSWELDHSADFFWGARDKECDRAGWQHAMLNEFARIQNFEAGTWFGDLDKFYERVGPAILFEEAEATGVHLGLTRAAIVLYTGARALNFQGAASNLIEATGTILAGCSLATTFAKVVLHRLLVSVIAAFPALTIRNVIDDVSVQALGTTDFVCEQLGKAAI